MEINEMEWNRKEEAFTALTALKSGQQGKPTRVLENLVTTSWAPLCKLLNLSELQFPPL